MTSAINTDKISSPASNGTLRRDDQTTPAEPRPTTAAPTEPVDRDRQPALARARQAYAAAAASQTNGEASDPTTARSVVAALREHFATQPARSVEVHAGLDNVTTETLLFVRPS